MKISSITSCVAKTCIATSMTCLCCHICEQWRPVSSSQMSTCDTHVKSWHHACHMCEQVKHTRVQNETVTHVKSVHKRTHKCLHLPCAYVHLHLWVPTRLACAHSFVPLSLRVHAIYCSRTCCCVLECLQWIHFVQRTNLTTLFAMAKVHWLIITRM